MRKTSDCDSAPGQRIDTRGRVFCVVHSVIERTAGTHVALLILDQTNVSVKTHTLSLCPCKASRYVNASLDIICRTGLMVHVS